MNNCKHGCAHTIQHYGTIDALSQGMCSELRFDFKEFPSSFTCVLYLDLGMTCNVCEIKTKMYHVNANARTASGVTCITSHVPWIVVCRNCTSNKFESLDRALASSTSMTLTPQSVTMYSSIIDCCDVSFHYCHKNTTRCAVGHGVIKAVYPFLVEW